MDNLKTYVCDSSNNNWLFNQISKFFQTDISQNTFEYPHQIKSTETNKTYIYGVLPTRDKIKECKVHGDKNCIKKLQLDNYMDEYTVRTVNQDQLMVPWSIEMFFNTLLNTSSNISFNDIYYNKDSGEPDPVYTHEMKKVQVKNNKDILFNDSHIK